MTWSVILNIILFVAIAAIVVVDASFIRELRKDNVKLKHSNRTLLHIAQTRGPANPGWRSTDDVVAAMKFCYQCDGLRQPEHFVVQDDHSHL